jgi:RNA polymerase sigma-70 factor (family 1)
LDIQLRNLAQQSLHNEKELLQQVAAGDEAAYKILFTNYWDKIYSTALLFTKSPELAEDLTQDIFARIWVQRAKLAEVYHFEGFLFIMARNLVFNSLRREVYHTHNQSFFEDYFADPKNTIETNLETKEFEQLIHSAINELPAQQQTAFKLSRFQGLNHEEIAQEMGISAVSVKSYIVRAIRTLRDHPGLQGHSLSLIIWILLFL